MRMRRKKTMVCDHDSCQLPSIRPNYCTYSVAPESLFDAAAGPMFHLDIRPYWENVFAAW